MNRIQFLKLMNLFHFRELFKRTRTTVDADIMLDIEKCLEKNNWWIRLSRGKTTKQKEEKKFYLNLQLFENLKNKIIEN